MMRIKVSIIVVFGLLFVMLISGCDKASDISSSSGNKESIYTAEQLSTKSLDEIIDIMGGDFQHNHDKGVIYYTSDPNYIYNDDYLPGFVFYLKREDVEDDLDSKSVVEIKKNIADGKYTLDFIAVYPPAKLDDNISANMHYSDFIASYGDTEAVILPGSGYPGHSVTDYNKGNIDRFIVFYEKFDPSVNLDEINLGNFLRETNPRIHAIAAFPKVEEKEMVTEEKSDKWKSLYIEYINNLDNLTGYESFDLIDIDDNGIPELFFSSGIYMNGGTICTVCNDEIITADIGSFALSYCKNYVSTTSGRQGMYGTKVFEVSENGIDCVFFGRKEAKTFNFDDNNPDDFTYKYNNDGSDDLKEVSYDEYTDAFSAYFDIDEERNVSMQYDYSGIIDIIDE